MNAQSTSTGEATEKALLMIKDQIYRAYLDEITGNKKILSLSLKSLWNGHKISLKLP